MPGAVREGARALQLRRKFFARIRFCGVIEFGSLLGLLGIGLLRGRPHEWEAWVSAGWLGDALLVAYLVAAVAVRVAVATEYVSADQQGVRWRSLFRSSFLPWDQIESMDIGKLWLFPSNTRDDVIEIRTTAADVWKLRASAWCDSAVCQWVGDALELRAAGRR